MKVEDNRSKRNEVYIEQVKGGEVLTYGPHETNFYIKINRISNGVYNAMNVETGALVYIVSKSTVTRVNAKLVVED